MTDDPATDDLATDDLATDDAVTDDAATDDLAARILITGGNPTADEIAALTAVVSAALDEIAGETRPQPDPGPTAWERSTRAVRRPLTRGDWRHPTR